ncbi:MAG TPA: F0F1 ATP synthase subunit A [Vicinamibacterales bacterium]|nr:F0F1 ATP synthase subunit A [Vicinamibacterales bacterium]
MNAQEHESPLEHVVQHPLIEVPAPVTPLTPNGTVTVFSDQIAMLALAGVLLVALVPALVRRRKGASGVDAMVAAGPANMLEAVCEYLRKEVAEPALHEHTDRFIKYIWSVFFFVLTVNILGLLPIPAVSNLFGTHLGGTATGNIWVTATLAIITMIVMVINGLRIGGKHYLAHFCPGPIWMAPLLVPVEIIGLIAKVFALAVRLFANMIAGHILLAVLLSFIMAAGSVSAGLGVGVGALVVAGSVAINFLELFVAFLQAFIFTFLTTLFIGMSVVFHHEDHGDKHHDPHDVIEVNPDQVARAV